MNLHLSNKVALITGASRGIGQAIAETLAGEGMKLVLAARSRDKLEELASSLKTECLVQAVDLREPNAPAIVINAAIERFGQLDVVVKTQAQPSAATFSNSPKRIGAMVLLLSFTAQYDVHARRGNICKRVTAQSSTSSASAGARAMPNLRLAGR